MYWLWQDLRDHLLYGRNKQFILLSVFLVVGCGETTYTVFPTTSVREYAPGNLAQPDRIVQFPVRQQSRIGSDLGTVELKLEPTVKI